uniref:RRM domain-containing protein n=1 Tax=Heterorhabditis bacteriophora TaxID=37862 RepID=A0A1I7X9B9_HETBA
MGVVDDLMVFYHPSSRKHLGIGMVVFHTSSDAAKFITQFNGKPVMGSIIKCCLDPYFAYLSRRYEEQTGAECPTPIHLKGLDERFLLLKRNEITMANTG